jgi:hypothetical protein
MKKVLFAIALMSVTFLSNAQEKRLNLYGGYVFDDNFESFYDSYNYVNGKIKGGLQYGAGLEFMVKHDYGVELLYIGQSTTAPTHYYSSGYYFEKYSEFDLGLNFAMLAGTRYTESPNGKLEGYGSFMLGALFANVKNPDNGLSETGTKFAWGLRLGGNIWFNDHVGLKIQGQLLSAVQSVGGSLYFGTGGAGAGVSTYSSMLQFTAGGGLVFKFGGEKAGTAPTGTPK